MEDVVSILILKNENKHKKLLLLKQKKTHLQKPKLYNVIF